MAQEDHHIPDIAVTSASTMLSSLPSRPHPWRLPLKSKILDPQNVNDAAIKTILENGAIDHHDNGGIYVTEYPLNFWLDVDEKRKLIVMYSYWDIVPDADEIDILRMVNHANSTKLLLQFSYYSELGRFYAYYTHPYHVGLIPTHVLKLAQRFSPIFQEVVDDGIEKGMLVDPSDGSADDGEKAADAASDSTVH